MGVESRYGLKFGYMDHGPRNLITDVPGVRVGHVTLHDGEVHTGVTAIIPHTGDVFHEKCLAGAHVINGFGKSIGLVQVQERSPRLWWSICWSGMMTSAWTPAL